MHIGRRYKFTEFLGWTRWEAGYLIIWSLLVTAFLQATHWNFLTIPAPILTIVDRRWRSSSHSRISNVTRALMTRSRLRPSYLKQFDLGQQVDICAR
jgi:hypothetical protein